MLGWSIYMCQEQTSIVDFFCVDVLYMPRRQWLYQNAQNSEIACAWCTLYVLLCLSVILYFRFMYFASFEFYLCVAAVFDC